MSRGVHQVLPFRQQLRCRFLGPTRVRKWRVPNGLDLPRHPPVEVQMLPGCDVQLGAVAIASVGRPPTLVNRLDHAVHPRLRTTEPRDHLSPLTADGGWIEAEKGCLCSAGVAHRFDDGVRGVVPGDTTHSTTATRSRAAHKDIGYVGRNAPPLRGSVF